MVVDVLKYLGGGGVGGITGRYPSVSMVITPLWRSPICDPPIVFYVVVGFCSFSSSLWGGGERLSPPHTEVAAPEMDTLGIAVSNTLIVSPTIKPGANKFSLSHTDSI
jgi:hypothetical protein